MDEKTHTNGILEEMEKGTNKMAESPETWDIQFECGNTRKFKKRLLAHCRQPNYEHRPLKRKA